ncbi:MAG TPA: VOC family protein [Steroidobacteraceae bacterium]|nr:VOC family protein [Steroidobacteraceae bacterium]
MNDFKLDHVCLAVRKIAPARAMLEKMLGYQPRTEIVHNTRQRVNVQFMSKSGSLDIKLIEPDSMDSPLVEFIKERGGGLHHLAFRTGSVEDGIAELSAKQARIVAAPAPGEAFNEETIAFAFLGAGLNVELIDTDLRRGEIAPK